MQFVLFQSTPAGNCCRPVALGAFVTFTMLLAVGLNLESGMALAHQDSQSNSVDDSIKPVDNSNLATLLKEWKQLDAQLAKMQAEFEKADDPQQQETIAGQYKAMVKKSGKLVDQIKASAIAAFEKNPTDPANTKLLVGLIMNDTEFERNNDAMALGDRLIVAGVDGGLFETAAKAARLSVFSRELLEELAIRARQAKQNDLPQVRMLTSKGELVIELFEDEAPNTVANFISLIEDKFYDGLKFHRVIEGFVAQGGDPKGDGSGGPGHTIKCECPSPESRNHFVGSLSMAHGGPDTGGSQFFLCLDRTSQLDGKHTVFGRVIQGIDVLDKLARNYTSAGPIPDAPSDVITKMEIIRKRDHAYEPVKVPDTADGG